MVLTPKKTTYEKKMNAALENDSIVFYDYIQYKKTIGWWTDSDTSDWNRPLKIKRAKYHGAFLNNLPNYYFLGFPIKDLIKSNCSRGFCHACAVALSLYFDDFEIITCNLSNYVHYYNKNSYRKIFEFEHSFIVVNINGVKTVIDTTWGIITPYDVYDNIFKLKDIKRITGETLKSTSIYRYIEKKKYQRGPSIESQNEYDEEYAKYILMLDEYTQMCDDYTNLNDSHLERFINSCLYGTSNTECFKEWRYQLHSSHQIDYPTDDLFSLTDDINDFTLNSPYEYTNKRNQIVLENYENQKYLNL